MYTAMMVEEQNVITLAYELREGGPEGELLERMDAHYPFRFLFGSGLLLPAFEARLQGLSVLDGFEFTLSPAQAYGPVDPAQIMALPRSAFGPQPEIWLAEGLFVELTDEDGKLHPGKIVRWDDRHVTVDFNHAMAGKTLHFKGFIIQVRPATIDELVQRRYIEEDGLRFGQSRPWNEPDDEDDEWWKNG
jgi:FKBP-type peptidyl-prolyl cis-trans isomerase SlyD